MEKFFEYEEICANELFDYYDNSKKIFTDETYKKIIKNPILSDFGLVKINKKNIKMIERILLIDSAYSYKDSNSTMLIKNLNNVRFKEQIMEIVKKIDLENSTHINSDNVGYEQLPIRLFEKYNSIEEIKKGLKSKNYEIISLLSYFTENNVNNKKIGNRNISFATKFCAYMSLELFEDFYERDRYAKYDNIVAKVIPLYLYYYNKEDNEIEKIIEKYKDILYIPTRGKNKGKIINVDLLKGTEKIKNDFSKENFIKKISTNYKLYIELINYIISEESESKITKNGLDHLLWYYYKGKL